MAKHFDREPPPTYKASRFVTDLTNNRPSDIDEQTWAAIMNVLYRATDRVFTYQRNRSGYGSGESVALIEAVMYFGDRWQEWCRRRIVLDDK